VLKEDPRANAAAVNEAWRAAGRPGEISAGLVNHLRHRMGLSGNLRDKKASGTERRGQPNPLHPGANGGRQAPSRRSMSELAELEVAIDRLLMKVAEIAPLANVEYALREVRRRLYAAMVAVA
jgi:hypothetical protein